MFFLFVEGTRVFLLVIKLIEGKLVINIIIGGSGDNRVTIESVVDIVLANIYIREDNKYRDYTVRSRNIFDSRY